MPVNKPHPFSSGDPWDATVADELRALAQRGSRPGSGGGGLLVSEDGGGGVSVGASRPQTPWGSYSSPTTIGAATEGSETASTDTWDRTSQSGAGLDEWYVSRVVYNHSGDKVLYAFLRKRTYDSFGMLRTVSAETRVSVDATVTGCT